jgi:Fasciclin domain
MRSHLTQILLIALSVTTAAALQNQPQAPVMKPSEVSASLLISDVLPRQQRIGIFSGFTRDVDTVSSRLESSAMNTTVLAPNNEALRALPRKPWEDPEEYKALGENAYGGEDGNKRAQDNLKRFVEAHVVPKSPWEAGEKVKSLTGNELWYEIHGDKMLVRTGKHIYTGLVLTGAQIQPGNIEVQEVADKVANGEVWVLKGCINYAR